jgi:hypothetical protein
MAIRATFALRSKPGHGLLNYEAERGAVLVLAAVAVAALVLVVAFVLNGAYWKMVESDLRATADAAAHAGAATLCSTRTCYQDARSVALDVLEKHAIHGRLGGATRISLDHTAGPVWEDPSQNVKVTIYRGRWWPNGAPDAVTTLPDTKFEPFDQEGTDWQASHLGTPDFMAANAVYVRVERPNVDTFMSAASRTYSVSWATTAVAGALDSVCVAPFAIPVCALLDESGEYHPEISCHRDRLFTATDRYCPPGTDCNIVPGFMWAPLTSCDPSEPWEENASPPYHDFCADYPQEV